MFTGIVETQGIVTRRARRTRLEVRAPQMLRRVPRGGSVAVNGVCLSVAASRRGHLSFDVIPETLRRTNLSRVHPGDRVNLERALRVGDRLNGHLLLGHVDGTARVVRRTPRGREAWLEVEVPRALRRYLLPKGSVALDGVSLTVGRIRGQRLRVYLIPTTITRTTLGHRQVGEHVNLEVDVLTKLTWQRRREMRRRTR